MGRGHDQSAAPGVQALGRLADRAPVSSVVDDQADPAPKSPTPDGHHLVGFSGRGLWRTPAGTARRSVQRSATQPAPAGATTASAGRRTAARRTRRGCSSEQVSHRAVEEALDCACAGRGKAPVGADVSRAATSRAGGARVRWCSCLGRKGFETAADGDALCGTTLERVPMMSVSITTVDPPW